MKYTSIAFFVFLCLQGALLQGLEAAAGKENVSSTNPIMASEDFSFFLNEIPGMYFFLGISPEGIDPMEVESNHSPRFQINEDALKTGIRAFSYMVLEYTNNQER